MSNKLDSRIFKFPSATIIVADDDAGMRETTAEFLTMCGYRVFEAISATEALDILEQHKIDLMTTDVSKPGMDGYDLTRIVKDKYGIPVIIMTGYKGHTTQDAFEAGADIFMYKPVKFKNLLSGVKYLLDSN